ncbi:MAG: pyridoxal phosphate-dependent aminotransferase [Patescibacteria group bacterium]
MIAKRVQHISASPTLAITATVNKLKSEGKDVISFAAGEPDFDTPKHIKQAGITAINMGFTKYTATSGIIELKLAICEKFKKDNNLIYKPENILVSNGAKQCLYNLIQVLVDPEDEVLIQIPYWVSYEEMVKLAGGKCVFLKPNKQLKITANQIDQSISAKTKILILNSPSNPSGVVYDKKELEEIARVLVAHNILVISDEIYEKLIYGKKHHSIASINSKINKLTVVVNGVSKSYAMTGWRIGYCAGPKEIIKMASSLQDHSTSNPNSIAQKAAIAALTGSEDCIQEMVREYRKRRDYMIGRLRAIKGIKVDMPDGAFYAYADVSKLYNKNVADSVSFCTALLKQFFVGAIPGSAFGDDRYIRLSFATSLENIKEGMERLEKFAGDPSFHSG